MPIITLDIETIGTTDPAAIEDIRASIKPPGNIKKPESIDKWMAEEMPAVLADKVAATSFEPRAGAIGIRSIEAPPPGGVFVGIGPARATTGLRRTHRA